jgi:hypothetical protein
MAASISDSDRDNEAIPSLVAATPSPSNTPARKVSPKHPGSSKSRPRKERISPQEDAPSPSRADVVSHELFGDYMSIEELATQTEKAYEERKAAGSPRRYNSSLAGSPVRTISPKVSPRVSPRRLSKKKADGLVNSVGSSSGKRSKDTNGKSSDRGGYVLASLVLVTIVLPFLLCESFLLALTWRYKGVETELNSNIAAVEKDASRDLLEVHEESCSSPSEDESFANDDEFATRESNESERNVQQMDDEQDQLQEVTMDLTTNAQTNEQDVESSSISTPETEVDATSSQLTKQQQLKNENQQMLEEAFTLIATARSLSKWEMIEQITSAEILCRTVSFRAKEMGLMAANELDGSETTDYDKVTGLFFQSNLCIGGAKMSMSVKDLDGMLADAKQVFGHLVSRGESQC